MPEYTAYLNLITACRLAYAIEMLCILCELVIAACTLVFLFNLQQAMQSGREGAVEHTRRDMALGFLSLAFTAAVLLVMVIGTEKLTRVTRTAWTRVNASHAEHGTRSHWHGGSTRG